MRTILEYNTSLWGIIIIYVLSDRITSDTSKCLTHLGYKFADMLHIHKNMSGGY